MSQSFASLYSLDHASSEQSMYTFAADIVSRLRYQPTLLKCLRRVATVLARGLSALVSSAAASVMDVRIPSAFSLGRRRQKQVHISACDGYFQRNLTPERSIMTKIVTSAIMASLGQEGLALVTGSVCVS